MKKHLIFPYLKAEDYQHPKENAIDRQIINISKEMSDTAFALNKQVLLGQCIEIRDDSPFRCIKILNEACKTLNYTRKIRVFIKHEYTPQVLEVSGDDNYIVISDEILTRADELMMLFWLGKAISMFDSGHAYLATIHNVLPFLPLGKVGAIPLQACMRAAELSSDRGGLLACQSFEAAARCLLWEIGFPPETSAFLSYDAIQAMTEDYVRQIEYLNMNTISRASTVWQTMTADSAPVFERLAEIQNWYNNGYRKLVIKGRLCDD